MPEPIKTVDTYRRSTVAPFMIQYECPECGATRELSADRWNAAPRLKCLACGAVYQIPTDPITWSDLQAIE